MKKSSVIVFLVLITSFELFAQGGSNYSIFGLGDLYHSVGAYYDGLAGTSAAIPAPTSINSKNPALWSFVKNTRLQAGYRFNQHLINKDDMTLRQNNGKLNGIQGLFMIDTSNGLAVSFGMTPYSTVNYLVAKEVTAKVDDLSLTGITTYQGIGGVNLFHLGISMKIFDNLSVGVAGFAAFGRTTSTYETVFNERYTFIQKTSIDDFYEGYGIKAGLYYNVYEGFSIGMYMEKHFDLSVRSDIVYGSDALEDSVKTCNLEFRIPDLYGFGASLRTGKFIVGADIAFQDFSNFEYERGLSTEFQNSMQTSIGLSRLGSQSYSATFFDKATYNFGLGYKQLYYKVDNTAINEIFGSFGISFDLPGTAIIDGAIIFGKRGTSDSGLLEEFFGRLSIDISIGETWFKPFRRNY